MDASPWLRLVNRRRVPKARQESSFALPQFSCRPFRTADECINVSMDLRPWLIHAVLSALNTATSKRVSEVQLVPRSRFGLGFARTNQNHATSKLTLRACIDRLPDTTSSRMRFLISLLQSRCANVRVDLSRHKRLVTQQLLYAADVGATV